MFEEGDIVKWYPGETDYPSVVKLIRRIDDNTWLVNYAEHPNVEDWEVNENELVTPKYM